VENNPVMFETTNQMKTPRSQTGYLHDDNSADCPQKTGLDPTGWLFMLFQGFPKKGLVHWCITPLKVTLINSDSL
jgi:hypothetical protein